MREYEINLRIKTKNRKVVDKLQTICDNLPKGEYYSMECNSTPLKSELASNASPYIRCKGGCLTEVQKVGDYCGQCRGI